MQATANWVVGQRLRVAKRQFELWLRGCRRPGPIPTELWVLAAEAAELGIEETACQLQVNAERLEELVEELGLVRGPKESVATGFVDLSPMPWGAPQRMLSRAGRFVGPQGPHLAHGLERGSVYPRASGTVRQGYGRVIQTGPAMRILAATQSVDFCKGISPRSRSCSTPHARASGRWRSQPIPDAWLPFRQPNSTG